VEYLDPRGRKRVVHDAEWNIWTQEGRSEWRMVLREYFGPEREVVRGEWC